MDRFYAIELDSTSTEFIRLVDTLNQEWDIPYGKMAEKIGIKDTKMVNIKRGLTRVDEAHVIALKSVYAKLLELESNTSLTTLREEMNNGFERVLEKLGDIKGRT